MVRCWPTSANLRGAPTDFEGMSDLHGKLCHDFRLFQRRPWRRKEYAFVVAIGPAEALDNWLSRKMLKRGDSIDQASVEKDPARGRVSVGPVGE